MKPENRARPTASRCTWLLILVIFWLLIGLIVFYVFTDFNEIPGGEYTEIGFTSRYSLDEMRAFAYKNSLSRNYKPNLYVKWNLSFNRIFEDSENKFDISGNDVIVFLHIQKTAGTSFERFLVKYLNISHPCSCNVGKKRCSCLRPHTKRESWLFSRYSTGWACGLHADFTELSVSGCVDHVMDKRDGIHVKRRYFYTTFLREPVARFISEYRHVERGATWLSSRHVCSGKPPTPEQLPMCFDPEVGWDGVSMEEFLSCPFNLAFNRQTRMLADLTLVNCYDTSTMNRTTRDRLMLESAKNNLKNLAFFGLKERMEDSQFMFEKVFQMTFTRNLAEWNKSKSQDTEISPAEMRAIREKNALDIQLYEFAIKLFNKRLSLLRNSAEGAATDDLFPKPVVYFRTDTQNISNPSPPLSDGNEVELDASDDDEDANDSDSDDYAAVLSNETRS